MAIVGNISSEEGDVIRIKTDVPVIGIVSLYSFIDDLIGEDGTKFFNKSFRYSVDGGLNFTSWFELTTINIQNIVVTRKDQFTIDYKYVRVGGGSGDISFNSLALSGDFSELPYPVYNRNFFSIYFDVNDVGVLNWALNVLEKIYSKGLLPDYIIRKWEEINPSLYDADFTSLFGTLTHFFAIIVHYARQYNDITNNPLFLRKFLENIGLYLNNDITDEELTYLFENYPEEFRKRGTNAITTIRNSLTIPDGELVRLIEYKHSEEFLLATLEPHSLGWCVSKSSPCYNGTRQCLNMIKGYEQTEGIKDKSKYPIYGDCYYNPTFKVLSIDPLLSVGKCGLYADDIYHAKPIRVSPNMRYEILMKIKEPHNIGAPSQQLYFGCKFYDGSGVETVAFNLKTKTLTENFFENESLPQTNREYLISGILYENSISSDISDDFDMTLNIGFGGHLRIPSDAKFMMPFVYIYNTNISVMEQIFVSDFKVRPANFNFSLGRIGLKDVMYFIYNNMSSRTNSEIYDITSKKLISFKYTLIDNEI